MKQNTKMYAIVLIQIIALAYGQGHDSRCYLESGGSAENFIVSEDISVGAIIGKLKINGNPAPNGNIKLTLRERDRDAPVEIEPGTKDLILTSPLDKEGERGPASVYVNVVCDRLHSEAIPSFVIPVNIRITDVNDNAPQWRGAPYSISLSETTVVGTRILQGARAVDADQPGPFSTVEYSVLPGPFSDFVDFVNPLEGTLQLKKTLDYEQLKNFTVKLRAQDQGTPPKFSDTFLRVFIIDADDQNPRFEYESYTAEFPPDDQTGRLKIYPKAVRAWDQDEGIQADIIYSITSTSSPDAKYFSINPKSGEIELITPFDSQKTTLVIRATQIDNKDRFTFATVNIMRTDKFRHDLTPDTSNTNDNRYAAKESSSSSQASKLQFIQPKHLISVRENTPAGSRILSLPTNRPGDRNNLRYSILEHDQSEYFEIGQYGDVILRKQLDFEKIVRHLFHVTVVDEQLNNATCQVIVDVLNVNDWDPRFRQPHYRFKLPTRESLNESYSIPMAVGRVEAADGDAGDKISFNLRGQHSSLFSIDSRGMIWLKEPLHNLKKSEISLIATATDSGQRSTSVPITFVTDPEASTQARLPSFFGIFGLLFLIFVIVVILISIYVYKRKSNQIHSNLPSMQSSAGLVSQEKRLMNSHMCDANQDQLNFCNSGAGNLSPGTSSIIGSTFDAANHQHHHIHHHADSKSTIGAMSRANYRGRLYNTQQITNSDDIEKDSMSNSDTTKDLNIMNRIDHQRNKKLSWQHDDFQKNDVSGSLDLNGSTENNLIVYF